MMSQVLMEKLVGLKLKLSKVVQEKGRLTDPAVITISQEMDKVIVKILKEK